MKPRRVGNSRANDTPKALLLSISRRYQPSRLLGEPLIKVRDLHREPCGRMVHRPGALLRQSGLFLPVFDVLDWHVAGSYRYAFVLNRPGRLGSVRSFVAKRSAGPLAPPATSPGTPSVDLACRNYPRCLTCRSRQPSHGQALDCHLRRTYMARSRRQSWRLSRRKLASYSPFRLPFSTGLPKPFRIHGNLVHSRGVPLASRRAYSTTIAHSSPTSRYGIRRSPNVRAGGARAVPPVAPVLGLGGVRLPRRRLGGEGAAMEITASTPRKTHLRGLLSRKPRRRSC
jgi:hypothetical protein